ncbi:VWA domain-containing protein [bacterium]|nr:VWA domain-containing protein [bacterium]
MQVEKKIFNLIILDESGSMESIKTEIISGFNGIVQTIKSAQKKYSSQEHFVTLVTFNTFGIKEKFFNEPIGSINPINNGTYIPDAGTPLFDAMGISFVKLKREIAELKDYNVLVTILTDGMENASREFSLKDIKKLITELKEQNWTFTYIGTEHKVEEVADNFGIDRSNVMRFEKANSAKMFQCEISAKESFYENISMRRNVSMSYFPQVDDKEKKDEKKSKKDKK